MALICFCLSDVTRAMHTFVPGCVFSVAEAHQSDKLWKFLKTLKPEDWHMSDMDLCESSRFSHIWESWHKNSQIWKKHPCRLTAQMNLIVCTGSVLLLHTVTTLIWLFFFALTSKMSLIGVCIINAIGLGCDPAPCQELLCSPICCKTAFSSTLFLF